MAVPVAPPPLTRRERVRGPLLTVGALAAATLALRLRDPHRHGSWGVCPLSLAGIQCPGCGGLRAVNDLTHGDLAGAASSNLLVTLGVPVAAVVLALWVVAAWRGGPPPRLPRGLARRLGYAAAAFALCFAVLRNTPWGAWLAP
jgi:hypothetical protein